MLRGRMRACMDEGRRVTRAQTRGMGTARATRVIQSWDPARSDPPGRARGIAESAPARPGGRQVHPSALLGNIFSGTRAPPEGGDGDEGGGAVTAFTRLKAAVGRKGLSMSRGALSRVHSWNQRMDIPGRRTVAAATRV